MTGRYPEPRAGRFTPPGEQRTEQGREPEGCLGGSYPARGPLEPNQPTARPSFESYGWYEEFSFTLPAGTLFVEAGRFSGTPDAIHVSSTGGTFELRLAPRGGSPGSIYNVSDQQKHELNATGEVVFARDPTGAGGTTCYFTGRFSARGSEPRRALVHQAAPAESM